MNRFFALAAVSLLIGCPEPEGSGTADTSSTTPPAPEVLAVVAGTVDCIDDTTVEMTMSTTGDAASAEIFSQETANESEFGQWSENTNLVDTEGNGEWLQTLRSIDTPGGETFRDVVIDETTLFQCSRDANDNPQHHNASVMTYVFRAYDINDTEFDCVVAGDDPDGFLAGDYEDDRNNVAEGPTMPDDIIADNCTTATFSY